MLMRKYTRDNLIVNWYPDKCTHAAICVRSLPKVFQPRKRPWVNLENASIEEIISVVEKCPSKALTYELIPMKNY